MVYPPTATTFRKKIKAKVGKRAPKQHTHTDTTFQAARVSLASQVVPTSNNNRHHTTLDDFSSSLQYQLAHHNAHNRLAALKQLRQLHHNNNNDFNFERLLSWIAPLATLDPDADVRGCATELFDKQLLSQQQQASIFGPSILNYLFAGLNALDVECALHAASLVTMVAERSSSRTGRSSIIDVDDNNDSGSTTTTSTVVEQLLLSLTRLLGLHDTKLGKRQRGGGSGVSPKKMVVVNAIRAVLVHGGQTTSRDYSDNLLWQVEEEEKTASVSRGTNGPCRSLVMASRPTNVRRRRPSQHTTLDQLYLSSEFYHSQQTNHSSSSNNNNNLVEQLLTKLRDLLMETKHPESVTILCQTIQLVLHKTDPTSHNNSPLQGGTTAKQQPSIQKVCQQIGNTLLDKTSSSQQQSHSVWMVLLTMAAFLQNNTTTNQKKYSVQDWVVVVANQVQQALEDKKQQVSCSLLDVLEQLLVWTFPLDNETRWSITELFCSGYFDKLQESEVGTRAVQLGCRLLEQSQYNLKRAKQMFGPAISDIVAGLPKYLLVWKARELSSSSQCLSMIQSIVRCVGQEPSTALRIVLGSLREGLEPLVASSPSVLELYPVDLQRQVVCLLTTLLPVSERVIQSLAHICERNRHSNNSTFTKSSDSLASLIVHCVHRIRRELSMQVYLSFLVDSSGLLNLHCGDSRNVAQLLVTAQQCQGAVEDLCACVVDCGPEKVLPKLEGVMRALLKSTSNVVQVWAAVSILALWSLEISMDGKLDASVMDCFGQDFIKLLAASICRLFTVEGSDNKATTTAWLRPLIALMSSEPSVLVAIPPEILSRMDTFELCEQMQLLQMLLLVVCHEQLDLSKCGKALLRQIALLQGKAKGSHELYSVCEQMRARVELLSSSKLNVL